MISRLPTHSSLCWLVGKSVHNIHRFPRTDVPTSQHRDLIDGAEDLLGFPLPVLEEILLGSRRAGAS
jgi:hypothetical protein